MKYEELREEMDGNGMVTGLKCFCIELLWLQICWNYLEKSPLSNFLHQKEVQKLRRQLAQWRLAISMRLVKGCIVWHALKLIMHLRIIDHRCVQHVMNPLSSFGRRRKHRGTSGMRCELIQEAR